MLLSDENSPSLLSLFQGGSLHEAGALVEAIDEPIGFGSKAIVLLRTRKT
jgi:hypothetical protein